MKQPGKPFALCVDNTHYKASLIPGKVYRLIPDARAAKDDFVRVVDERHSPRERADDLVIPVIPLVCIGAIGALTYNISRAHNWARITLLIFSVLAAPVLFLLALTVFKLPAFVAMLVLQILAFYFLFTGVGARWFSRH